MRRIRVSEVLFVVQMAGMTFFTAGQFVRMNDSVQGVSPAWLLCALLFCALNLGLAWQGWREGRSREALLLVITHAGWVLALTALTALFVSKVSLAAWAPFDVQTLIYVVRAGIVVIFAAAISGRSLGDPVVRGLLAAILRGVPHLALAYKIGHVGGGGISALAVWTAHATALVRIGQLASVVRRDGWVSARRAQAWAEGVSETTWAVVTVVWILS